MNVDRFVISVYFGLADKAWIEEENMCKSIVFDILNKDPECSKEAIDITVDRVPRCCSVKVTAVVTYANGLKDYRSGMCNRIAGLFMNESGVTQINVEAQEFKDHSDDGWYGLSAEQWIVIAAAKGFKLDRRVVETQMPFSFYVTINAQDAGKVTEMSRFVHKLLYGSRQMWSQGAEIYKVFDYPPFEVPDGR